MLLAAVMKINVVSNEKEQVVVLISLHGTKNQHVIVQHQKLI